MTEEPVIEEPAPGESNDDDRKMSWAGAFGWAIVIFLYFTVASVWLVSFAVETVFADLGGFEGDLLVLGLWGAVMAGGFWGLLEAQRRGLFG